MSISEYDNIMSKLEEKSSTSPVVASLWIEYLKLKKLKLEDTIREIKNILEILDNYNEERGEHFDLSIETLSFIYNYMQIVR